MNKPPIPAVTRSQIVEIYDLMINEYGITLLQIMENAGRNLAELSRRLFDEKFLKGIISVVCAGCIGHGAFLSIVEGWR
jgi:NAD(P)H-hydrate epimerase